MPVTGPLVIGDVASAREAEVNHPGYYAATLNRWDTTVELTATRRVALHRYTFAKPGEAHITVDIARCLNKGAGSENQRFLGGEAHVISNREIQGFGRYAGGIGVPDLLCRWMS